MNDPDQEDDEEAEYEGQEGGPEASERQEKTTVGFKLRLGDANFKDQQRHGDGEDTITESFEA